MEFEGRSRIRTQLDIAPLVDIVFLLLVFFLLTSSFQQPEALDLVLPASATAESSDPNARLVVGIASDGSLSISGDAVTKADFGAVLARELGESSSKSVTLKSDRSVAIEQVAQVMDLLRAGGVEALEIATTAPAASRNSSESN